LTSISQLFTFEISTPQGWVQIPSGLLDEGQVEEWMIRISKLTDAGIPPAIESIARLVLERLNDQSSEFGAYFLDVFNDQMDEPPYVVFALLTLIPGNLEGEECPSVQDLAEQVRSAYGSTLTSTREIRTGDARECLSTSMVTKKSLGSGEDLIETEYLDLRVFVPLPEFDQIVSLLLVTPNVELEEEFQELFETIASTLAFEAAPEEDLAPS
jgi:hypothetical protein